MPRDNFRPSKFSKVIAKILVKYASHNILKMLLEIINQNCFMSSHQLIISQRAHAQFQAAFANCDTLQVASLFSTINRVEAVTYSYEF